MEISDQKSNELKTVIGRFIYHDIPCFLKYGTTDMFSDICIEISTKCNRKCAYCPNSKYDRGDHLMDMKTFKKIIQDLKALKYTEWVVLTFYNEPFLDKRLPDLLEYIKNELPKSKILIYSNGDFITQEILDKMDRYVDKYIITNHGNFNKNMPINSKMRIENLKYATTRGGLVEVPKDKTRTYYKKCYANCYLHVAWNGDIVICSEDYFGKYTFGNVNEESIKELWVKDDYRKTRRELIRGIPVFPICRPCMDKEA